MLRKFGIVLCIAGFFAVCAMALISTTNRPFAGLQGIQSDLANQGLDLIGDQAPGTKIVAEGRDLRVELPEVVASTFDRDDLAADLNAIEGVRNVELVGDPVFAMEAEDAPAARPTPATAADPTPAPAPDPTAEPTPEPAPDPTAEPAPEPTSEPAPEPSLSEIVAGFDLSTIEFQPGTAILTDGDQATLDGIVEQLQGQDGPIEVQSHTDNIGDPDVNLLLTQDRADAIVGYLSEQGVTNTLTARGFGSSQPIADNSTEQGRTDNRRVVFVVEGN